MDKLKSRKLWIGIAVMASALFLGISGNLEWSVAMKIILAAGGAYLGIEGLGDALGRLLKK